MDQGDASTQRVWHLHFFADPARPIELGFDVTANPNDVITIAIGGEGFDLRHILIAINYDGTPANVDGYVAPPIPDKWASLIQEFTQQLAHPASALYDDSHGTAGPVAKKNKKQAQVLAQKYARFASTFAIPNLSDSQIEGESPADDANERVIDTDATSNPMFQAINLKREEDPEYKNTVRRIV